MRIAIDVRSLMEGGVSGIERYTAEIVRAMARLVPTNEYHLFYNSAQRVQLPDFGEGVAVHGLRYPNKVFKMAQWAAHWPKWDWLLSSRLGGRLPDVVFLPSLGLIPLSRQVPLVSVFHDLSYEHFPELFNFKKRLWHGVMRPKVLAQRSQAIIAVSEHTKQDVVNLYGVPAEKVQVVYSGVSLGESRELNFLSRLALRPQTGAAAHAYSTKNLFSSTFPKKFVLYLGTLEPRKNVDSLVRAYSAIADSVEQDLVIAGAKGWSYGETLRAVAQSSARSRIHLLGFVPEEEKAALYGAADLFVYPSLYEGFGFPPLEALLAGTPVVTSYNSALPEVVGEWATLIDPYDVGELALVLKELLRDTPTVPSEVQAAIREKYSWGKAARETLRVLESVSV